MANKIKAVIKEPGKTPIVKSVDNNLESFQKLVGGYIETVSIKTYSDPRIACDFIMLVNEEGKLKDLPSVQEA